MKEIKKGKDNKKKKSRPDWADSAQQGRAAQANRARARGRLPPLNVLSWSVTIFMAVLLLLLLPSNLVTILIRLKHEI
jgi:hypothetical protein